MMHAHYGRHGCWLQVTRDNMMLKYHELYPQYGFNKHKVRKQCEALSA